MNWLFASTLMALCSLILYLAARKSALSNNSTELTNLAMYFIPTLVFIVMAIGQKGSFYVTPYQLLVLLVFAIGFSWLGNVASLKGIEYAPNPGYSLIIAKSYVVMTSITAFLVFGAELPLKSIIAIAIIIVGSAIISIGKSTNTKARRSWLPLSLLAFFCWGMISITSKYLSTIGVGVITLLVYMNIFVTTLILAEMYFKKQLVKPNIGQAKIFAVIGLSSAGFDYFMQKAFVTAPNIGYVNAINAGSIILVTIGSAILFKDELNWRKLTGVVVALIGLILLVI